MKILHIPTGTLCKYVLWDDYTATIIVSSMYDSIIVESEITEEIYNILWNTSKWIAIIGLREDGGTILYGTHPCKDPNLSVLKEEFELIE